MIYSKKLIGLNLILVLSLIFGCTSKSKHSYQIKLVNSESSLDSNLNYIIKSYIGEVDFNFPDKNWLYYYCFFFSEKNNKYVTIWVFPAFVDLSTTKNYIYGIQNVHNRNIVFVSEDHENYKDIYYLSDEAKNKVKIEKEKYFAGALYDGDLFFKTYEIINNKGSYTYRKITKAKVPFLDISPPEEYLH